MKNSDRASSRKEKRENISFQLFFGISVLISLVLLAFYSKEASGFTPGPLDNDPPFQGTEIDLGFYEVECGMFEIRLRPTEDVDALLSQMQFTIKWPENTVEIVDVESSFFVNQQGNTFTDGGFNYAVFIAVPDPDDGEELPLQWTAGEEYVILTFNHDQSGDDIEINMFIADDAWADENNGLFYVELWGADITGEVYHEPTDVFIGACSVVFLRVFLQGTWNAENAEMHTHINDAGNLPLQQPYAAAPWNYAGTEQVEAFNEKIVDWVLVELRDAQDPATVIESKAGLLRNDGKVMSTIMRDGLLLNSDPGAYHLVVKHRNHIPVMSKEPVTLPNAQNPYDFTSLPEKHVYKHNDPMKSVLELTPVGSGKYGMIAGDVNADGKLIYSGPQNDRVLILSIIQFETGSTDITDVIIGGYHPHDVNLNNKVSYSGTGNDRLILLQNIQKLLDTEGISGTYESQVP